MKLLRLFAVAAILSAFPAVSTPAGGASGAGETCGFRNAAPTHALELAYNHRRRVRNYQQN